MSEDIKKELEEIWDDPIFKLTEMETALFDVPADMKEIIERKEAEYVARYRPCEDFGQYQPLFQKVHAELRTGKRSIVKITKTANLKPRHFYYMNNVMVYLESVGELGVKDASGYKDGRTRCILENGTETDILLQTLRKNVVGSGYAITETNEETLSDFSKLADIAEEDISSGYIYVLRSLSDKPEIAEIQDLYKIGFTTMSVEQRIANAANEPTYLMAPVKVEAQYRIVNMNSNVYESLIHQLLDCVQMQISVYDGEGVLHHPKEWFQVPIEVVDTIIAKIVDGTIVNYTYNPQTKCLERVIKKVESTFDVSGRKVLTLNIKKVYFDEIMSGEKTIEYREVKPTTINKYTYVDKNDGKRFLRHFDILRLFVGYHKDRDSALVEVTDITYDSDSGTVEYHLGKVLEHVKPE